MNIQEIQIEKFPVVIFTDSHTNLSNIRKLKELYSDNQFISLGDFTFLFAKKDDKYNSFSIQYFIDNKIPVLEGNHESYIVASENGDSFITQRIIGESVEFNLSKIHLKFLENLPRGFKLVLPNGFNYYCFHNAPKDLWSFTENITEIEFRNNYISNSLTLGVIQGHLHQNIINNFSPKRFVIGQLCNSSHHLNDNKGGNYALLTEAGIEFKKL